MVPADSECCPYCACPLDAFEPATLIEDSDASDGGTGRGTDLGAHGGVDTPPLTRASFLAQCPPETALFFAGLMDRAERRGYAFYWGKAGFTVRIQLLGGKKASVLRCVPPDVVDCYTALLVLTEQQEAELRAGLESWGVFQRVKQTIVGPNALRAHLREGDTLACIQPAIDSFLDRVEQAVAAQQASSPP